MIDIDKVIIPFNRVLIYPDSDFKTYRDTSLLVSDSPEHQAQHFSIRGRVFQLPNKLVFNGDKINRFKIDSAADFESLKRISELKSESLLYKTSMELEIGDFAYFQYTEHYACYKNHRFIETDLGDMLLMDYDALICAHAVNQEQNLKMLNGFILIEPIKKPTIVEDGIEMMVNNKGVYSPVFKDMDRYIRSKKQQLGRVIKIGNKCQAYLEFPDVVSDPDIKEGDVIIYHPAYALRLEPEYHNGSFSDKKLLRMHRKDVSGIIEFIDTQHKEDTLLKTTEWLTLK